MSKRLPILAKLYIAKEILFKGAGAFQTVMSAMGGNPGIRDNSQKKMLEAYAYMPWLRAAFGKVADGLGSAAWYIEAASVKGKWIRNATWQNSVGLGRAAQRKVVLKSAKISQVYDHIAIELLAAPNPLMSGPQLMSLTCLHLDLAGECIWYLGKDKDKDGNISSIYPIPPHWIDKRPTVDTPFFTLVEVKGLPDKLPIKDVIWFRNPNPADPFSSTIGTAGPLADELESDEYASQHIKAWFLNRARPDIMVSGTGLEPEEVERAEERWLSKLSGFWKAHKPIFMGAEVKVVELTGKFNDMQMIELRKWQRDVVLQAVGLPPEILGVLESSNRATIETAAFIFARWVLTPRLDVIRAVLQTQFIPLFDDKLVIDYISPVEEDREFKLTVYKASPWAHTVNDWRELANDMAFENPEDGDYLMVPAAYVPTKSDDLENYESPYTAQQAGRPASVEEMVSVLMMLPENRKEDENGA